MSYKIFTKGNYFYIVDNDNNREYNALSKDVLVTRGTTAQDDFFFEHIDNWNGVENPLDISVIQDINGVAYVLADFILFYENNTGVLSSVSAADAGSNFVSVLNSTTTLLTNGSVFTGAWEDVSDYNSVMVAAKTDQNGTFTVEFSPDGVNQDSTLTRYYRTGQIEAPHRFTITRSYCRVVFTNDSGSDQTYLRLQTTFGTKADLNAPLDSTLAQDFDAIAVRPSDYETEVALNRRQGSSLWNKFGYNDDIDVGTEVLASWGGTFTPLLDGAATTLTIVSTDVNDIVTTGTGCRSIVVYGIDANREEVIEVVSMNGTTNVVTASTWLGINRVAMFSCGSGLVNAGTINITATTGGSQMAQMPIGGGVTQQCVFHVPAKNQFVAEWIYINVLNRGKNAELQVKMWVYSTVNNGKQEVFRANIDTQKTNEINVNPNLPFPISEKSVMWLEVTSDKVDVEVTGRFSGILERDSDA